MAQFIDAGADDRNPGEDRAIDVVRSLPNDWLVVANKNIPFHHGKSREIDLIIVAPHRVILLDEKSWHGQITGTDEFWSLADGASRPSPLKKIDYLAKPISTWFRDKIVGFPEAQGGVVPVIGGVILSNPGASAQVGDARALHCLLRLENAIDRLVWLDDEGAAAGFELAPLQAKLRTALFNKDEARAPKQPREMGLDKIIEKLDERDACRVFLGERGKGARRVLYTYENAPGADPLQSAVNRDLEALARLQDTGVVPRVHEPFLWNEDQFRVVPVDQPAGMAFGSLARATNEAEAVREIERAAAVFTALAKVHEFKIIHRAISPANVHVIESAPGKTGGTRSVMISGFVAAHIDLVETIAPALNEAGFDDPYAAPEIVRLQSYEYADASSDVYSLGLVTAARLTNLSVHQIRQAMERDQRLPDGADVWPYLPEAAIAPLEQAFNSVLNSGAFAGRPRFTAGEMATALTGIALDVRANVPWKRGEVVGDQFRIERLLGAGASARTYLAYDQLNRRLIAGKNFYRQGALHPQHEAVREFNILFDHPHANLPRPIGAPDLSRPTFQVILEYIDGETLRARLSRVKHDRNAWANVADGLLSAGGHLETYGLLHRDVKPENVMIREADDQVFLIDYGASVNVDADVHLAGTPRYWPPEWRASAVQPRTCDRYAIAVTLYEALTGELPFKVDDAAFSAEPVDALPDDLPTALHGIGEALLRGVAIDPAARFSTMREFKDAIDLALRKVERSETVDPLPPIIAPVEPSDRFAEAWIDGLRSLFRNTRRGNADNRGLDTPFARDTYVETALDLTLWPLAKARRPAAIFLSGNPGDGKTAFLERVRDDLVRAGATIADPADRSGWEATLGGHVFRACFDASESASGKSADEQLGHRLRGLDGAEPGRNLTVLVAINDGRLAEMLERFPAAFPWLTAEIGNAIEDRTQIAAEARPVWVVDLKQRSYVALAPGAAPSVMRQMVQTMVAEARWAGAPEALGLLAANAAALRADGPDSPAARLEKLLLLAHLRGERHTTVRDLRSALSLVITGDLAREDFEAPDQDVLPYSWSGKYWNTIFTTPEHRDLVLDELKSLDPARFAHPALERFLFFRHRPEDAVERAKLFVNGQDEPPPPGDDPERLTDWIAAVKRRFVLEGAPAHSGSPVQISPWDLLPYRAAEEFVTVLAGASDGATLLPKILRGIGRSDGIAEAMHTDDVVLIVKRSDEYDIEMVKSFKPSEFELSTNQPLGQQLVETQPRTLRLRHRQSQAAVQLNLDLVELLVRLADGLDPASAELRSLLEELGPFKSRLQRSSSNRLLVIEGGRRHWLIKEGEKIVRQDA